VQQDIEKFTHQFAATYNPQKSIHGNYSHHLLLWKTMADDSRADRLAANRISKRMSGWQWKTMCMTLSPSYVRYPMLEKSSN
jgi:hypothetical protein